jgi:[ribosomal protein S5]-alanine N-acetyltransferase
MRGPLGGHQDGGYVSRFRLVLRNPTARDSAAWCALIRTSRRFLADQVSTDARPEAYRAYLTRSRSPNAHFRLIWRAADRTLLGSINLSEIVRGVFQSAYLGYYLGAAFAGQGYMSEALALMLREAFGELRLHRIEANIQPANRASIALVRRAGFQQEGYSPRYLKLGGRWRDHERWALRIEQWRARRTFIDTPVPPNMRMQLAGVSILGNAR